jgi:hypothetical protein
MRWEKRKNSKETEHNTIEREKEGRKKKQLSVNER